MKVALLISTYNWAKALDLVLKSVLNQVIVPYEVLIADDGSSEETKNVINKWKHNSSLTIKHFWHEDNGFRKTLIMNKALASTSADYIIQIDCDIILETHFIKDHIRAAKKGFYIRGCRALISEDRTKEILNQQSFIFRKEKKHLKNSINATRIPFSSIFFRNDKFRSDNVKGCNFAFWIDDFIKVNGYNNDMVGWGHEDIELAARLTNLGIKQRQLKMAAICFHLHHDFNDRSKESINFKTYLDVVNKKITRCKNGLVKD